MSCPYISITNNIVSTIEPTSVDTTGYSVTGNRCNGAVVYGDRIFKSNVAHSIRGYGAIIFKDTNI